MGNEIITAVGIDVSKGKSMVAVRRPGGEVVLAPFQVKHSADELSRLVKTLRDVGGDIRIVMEHTGMYWRPIAPALKEAGFFVSIVNAMLIHDFSDNSLRKVKTDKADSMQIANCALSFWAELWDCAPEDETRQMLKIRNRLYLRTKLLITQAADSLNAVYDALYVRRGEMLRLASLLPEFEIVMAMYGAGEITGPQLMTEIGDVRRFTQGRSGCFRGYGRTAVSVRHL